MLRAQGRRLLTKCICLEPRKVCSVVFLSVSSFLLMGGGYSPRLINYLKRLPHGIREWVVLMPAFVAVGVAIVYSEQWLPAGLEEDSKKFPKPPSDITTYRLCPIYDPDTGKLAAYVQRTIHDDDE